MLNIITTTASENNFIREKKKEFYASACFLWLFMLISWFSTSFMIIYDFMPAKTPENRTTNISCISQCVRIFLRVQFFLLSRLLISLIILSILAGMKINVSVLALKIYTWVLFNINWATQAKNFFLLLFFFFLRCQAIWQLFQRNY